MESLLAGIFIGLGAIAYMRVGGIAGAFLFSIGLIAVLRFEAELFTGKAGLLATKEISPWKLAEIWLGNFLGTFLIVLLLLSSPLSGEISEVASGIMAAKTANGFWGNFALAIPCGILMYAAVATFKIEQPLYAILPVMVFICSGFNHVVADMAYCHAAMMGLEPYYTLLPTTLGNLIGCCLIPTVSGKRNFTG